MPVSCSSARRSLASASALRSFSISSRSFFRKCSSSLARIWSVMPSEFVTECLLRSVFHRSTGTGVAYNALLVTMVFQTLYYLVDLYWVGRLGKEAVAGVGIAGNFTFMVLAITQMLGIGTTTLVSHAAGQKD